jgi:hypothetical protein
MTKEKMKIFIESHIKVMPLEANPNSFSLISYNS